MVAKVRNQYSLTEFVFARIIYLEQSATVLELLGTIGWRNAILALFGLGSGPIYASDWTDADTAWQASYLALHVADWGQTRHIAKNPGEYYEVNPLLGDHPSVRRVDTYMAVSAITHTAIAYCLSPDWRRRFQQVTVGIKAGVVGYNYSIGLKMDF